LKDTTQDVRHHGEFHEELGRKYPESALVHGDRGPNSRYWNVWRELRPFARRGAHLLDVGCSDGVCTVPFCAQGGTAVGIDISPTLVARAWARAGALGAPCRLLAADIEAPDVADTLGETFDVALFSEVLEHLRAPERALRNLHRLLRPDGVLLLTAPAPLADDLVPRGPAFVRHALRGSRLREEQLLETTADPVLREAGVDAYRWRHDGCYPRPLRDWGEAHGFRCERCYTIGLVHDLTRRATAALLGEAGLARLRAPAAAAGAARPGAPRWGWARAGLRRAYHGVARLCELVQRRIPGARLVGVTSVGRFRRC